MEFKDIPAPPEDWHIIDWAYLQRRLTNEALKPNTLIRYFDGRNPTLRDALAEQEEVPRRSIVGELRKKLEDAFQQGLGVTVLLGGGGEGKSTVFLQTICDLLRNESVKYVILPKKISSHVPLSEEYLLSLPEDQGTWLIAADDAESIARNISISVSRLNQEGRKDIHFFLCCRDTDWRGIGANRLEWASNTDYFDDKSRLFGLKDDDAASIITAWRTANSMGSIASVSDEKAIQQLVDYARSESTQAEGSLLGAMLRTRIGESRSPAMREHVQRLLNRLEDRDKTKPYGQHYLLRAYAYIAAFHLENLFLLTEAILAQALGISQEQLQTDVIGLLGKEAGIATKPIGRQPFTFKVGRETIPLNSKKILLTRHKAIAETASDLLFNKVERFNPEAIYTWLYEKTVKYFDVRDSNKEARNNRVPDMKAWRKLPDYFFDSNRQELAIELAKLAIEDDKTDSSHIIRLASFYLENKQVEEKVAAQKAVKLYRDTFRRLAHYRKDSVYYNKWATAEGRAKHYEVSIWLDALGINDTTHSTSTYTASKNYAITDHYKLAMAGMSYDFQALYEQTEEHLPEQTIFLRAWRAIVQFGVELRWSNKSDANNPHQLLLQSQLDAWVNSNMQSIPPALAFEYMEKGIVAAWQLCQHELPDVTPADRLTFENFRKLVCIEDSHSEQNKSLAASTKATPVSTNKSKKTAMSKGSDSTVTGQALNTLYPGGDRQMTNEQKALSAEKFLEALKEQIINHQEFGAIYDNDGNLKEQVEALIVALQTNFQLLKEARAEEKLYPGNSVYLDRVQMRMQGLVQTTMRAETVWKEFRKETLARTETLITQLNEEAPQQIEQGSTSGSQEELEQSDKNIASLEGNGTTKQGRVSQALAGLNTLKTFLVSANDIKKAVNDLTPNLIEHIRSILEQMGPYIQHMRW